MAVVIVSNPVVPCVLVVAGNDRVDDCLVTVGNLIVGGIVVVNMDDVGSIVANGVIVAVDMVIANGVIVGGVVVDMVVGVVVDMVVDVVVDVVVGVVVGMVG